MVTLLDFILRHRDSFYYYHKINFCVFNISVHSSYREFVNAKSCLKESVNQHCQFDAVASEILQSAFDDYNPFCNVPSEEGKRYFKLIFS